jgi:nucleotide-binding universal stress UspA family protein
MPRNEITVDDSPSGRAALRWAAQYALTSGSPLRAIHILDWPYSVSSAGPEDIPPATMDEIESAPTSPTCSTRSTRAQAALWSS